MLKYAKSVWKEKKVWVILLCVQLLINGTGLFLHENIQRICMFISGITLMAFSIYGIYNQRGNVLRMLLNILLAYFNYSLVAAVYCNLGEVNSIFAGYSTTEFLKCINIELLFYGTYILCLDTKQSLNRKAFLEKSKPCFFIVIACTVYLLVAPFLFYKTEAFGVRGTITVLYEYALVIMIVALRFTGRDLRALAMVLAASAWIIIHGLLHGERVLALQMMIVWGCYLLLHVLSAKLIIPFCVVGIFGLTIFGAYRGLQAIEGNALTNVFNHLLRGGMANDTSYYAYWASMSITRFSELTSFFGRIWYFIKYVFYIVIGSRMPNVNLAELSKVYNPHAGGGWLPFYVNFWLGPVGVAISGGIIAWVLNKTTQLKKRRRFLNYLAIYIVATSPRWYLYSPSSITRGILFFSLFYCVCLVGRKGAPLAWPWLKKWFPITIQWIKKNVQVAWKWIKEEENW